MRDQHTASSTSNGGSARNARPYPDKYARDVWAERRRKDDAFRQSTWSPLPPSRLRTFEGLAYFRPDVSYRFDGLRLEPIGDDAGASFEIQTSDARPRPAYRLGRLRFAIEGRELALTAYRVGSSGSDPLFVPFRDATSGRGTYGAGRYLDIRVEADGSLHPGLQLRVQPLLRLLGWYSCPLPPAENWLPVRIEAGERMA